MAIAFVPRRGLLLICHYDMARVPLEMRKTRRAVVMSPPLIAQPSAWHRTWPLSGGPILRLTVWHLGDGRWWDTQGGSWRDGRERFTCAAIGVDDVLRQVRTTRVVLATAHCDHDTANNASANLAAFCQR